MGPINLSGKGAIVTGGGSGICFEFVKQLFEAGCNVLICDLHLASPVEAWMRSTAGKLTPARVRFHKTDVADWRQLETSFVAFEREFRRIPDILCPGAGVYDPSVANFWNDQDDHHYKVLRINLEHPIKMSRIAMRKWVQAGVPGTIIMVSSVGAQGASPVVPLYQVSKQGISCFTRCMARMQELAKIRVVAVSPGPTRTALMAEPRAARFVDAEKDKLAEPEAVGRGMMAVGFGERYPPGTVLEVTYPQRMREVFLLNDPGPDPSIWASKKDEAITDVFAALADDKAKL